jgi:hypothetical protein
MRERLFVKSKVFLSIDLSTNESIHIGDIVEVGYKSYKKIVLLNQKSNVFTTDCFLTLDNKRLDYDPYLSPLYDFKLKPNSLVLYFGEDTKALKYNTIYHMISIDEYQNFLLLEEYPYIPVSKTKFRLLTIEEERMLKMKSVGFNFVS